MDPNIKVIYFCFQGNQIDANKLCKCFSTCILNYKHMLQLHSSKEFKVLKIPTIKPPFVQFDSACHFSSPKSSICNLLNLKLSCLLNVQSNVMWGSNALIFLHHDIYLFRVPISSLYHIHDFHPISNKWVIYFIKCFLD